MPRSTSSGNQIREYLVALMKARGWESSQRVDALVAFDELKDALGSRIGTWTIGRAHSFFKQVEPGPDARRLREVFLLVCQLTTVPSLGRYQPEIDTALPEISPNPGAHDPNQTGNPWLRKKAEQTRKVTSSEVGKLRAALQRDPTATQRVPRDLAKAIAAASNDDVHTRRVPDWKDQHQRVGIQVSDVAEHAILIDWTGSVSGNNLHDTMDRALNLTAGRRTRYLLLDMTHAVDISDHDQIWLVGWIARLEDADIRELIIVRPEHENTRRHLGRVMRAVSRCRERLEDVRSQITEVDNKHQGMKLLQLHDSRQSPPLGHKKPR